jgi:CheY-like chemotaxis protein
VRTVHRLADRYTLDLVVELDVAGHRENVQLQDLSRTGMFLRVARPIAAGSIVCVALSPEGHRVVTTARVTHSLGDADARALGRASGIGLAFSEPATPQDQLFAIAVDRLLRARRATTSPVAMHIVVADSETRYLERMSTALGEAGFSVATATTGVEALAACLRCTPDVVLIERALPVFDGFGVLEQIVLDPELADVPVIVTSVDPNDVAVAFERGAADFIVKPFTTAEVIARARRLASSNARAADHVVLRGTLADFVLPSLLTMFEQQRKTGRLVVTSDQVAWIDIADGRIVGAGSSLGTDMRTTLHDVLDWDHGSFELSALALPHHDPELALPIMHLLLEHACAKDEASRGYSPHVIYALEDVHA